MLDGNGYGIATYVGCAVLAVLTAGLGDDGIAGNVTGHCDLVLICVISE